MRRITLDEQAQVIERWKAERGYKGRDYIPANSGRRRTAAKRALLRDMDGEDRRKGRKPAFKAKF
jgi:hypothetical protein